METKASATIITQCQHWVEQFIVPHSVCPFAKKVVDEKELDYQVIDSAELEQQVLMLLGQIQYMKSNASPETKLLIFPSFQDSFDAFLNFLAVCNQLLNDSGDINQIQLASFHPDYLFENEKEDGTSHYTNRSPWPMIHLIRQDSIAKALDTFPNPEQIPIRNIKLMQTLGKNQLAANLKKLQETG